MAGTSPAMTWIGVGQTTGSPPTLSAGCPDPAMTYRSAPERAAVAARMRRLIGHPRMIGAVRQAGDGLSAAKEEVRLPGIADRPAAGLLGEFEQGAALADRDDVVDERRLRLDVEVVGLHERGVAADRGPRHAQHVRRARLARTRRRRGR